MPTTRPVAAPSGIVPEQAIVFGAEGSVAIPVDAAHPLPVADRPYTGAVALAIGTAAPAGRAILIDCSVAGRVALQFADGSALSVPVGTGLAILPFAVVQVVAGGTTATASYASLV